MDAMIATVTHLHLCSKMFLIEDMCGHNANPTRHRWWGRESWVLCLHSRVRAIQFIQGVVLKRHCLQNQGEALSEYRVVAGHFVLETYGRGCFCPIERENCRFYTRHDIFFIIGVSRQQPAVSSSVKHATHRSRARCEK